MGSSTGHRTAGLRHRQKVLWTGHACLVMQTISHTMGLSTHRALIVGQGATVGSNHSSYTRNDEMPYLHFSRPALNNR